MKEGLARIDSSGGTAMRDAVKMSIDYTKVKATKDKKVILLITDGNDNSSSTFLEQVIKQAGQANVIVYAIGLFKGEDRHEAAHAKQALKELTSATGGLVFFPQDVSEIQQLAVEIARDIRLQYTIAYSPTIQALDGSYRKINVSVNAPGNPVARTRNGYYAVPDAAKANPQSETSKPGPSLPQ
jgi:VWFA-related protein